MSDLIGQQVAIPGTQGYGILRYLGPIQGKNGEFGGIELLGLLAKSRGKNSGSVNDIQYFNVKEPMSGLFLPIERLSSVNPQLARYKNEGLKSPISTFQKKTPLRSSSIQNRNELHEKYKPESPNATSDSRNVQVISQSEPSSAASSAFSPSTNTNLELELQEFKELYSQSQREMSEKIEILNKLQSTVSEIVPLLEEYEKDLIEKDRKLLKQKTDFEKQREEWRSTMELMSSTQQETETFYEHQLVELKNQFQNLSTTKDKNSPSSDKIISELEYKLIEKENENNHLVTKIKNFELTQKEMEHTIDNLQENNLVLEENIKALEKDKVYTETMLTQKINAVNIKEDFNDNYSSGTIDSLHLKQQQGGGVDNSRPSKVEPVIVAKQHTTPITELPIYKSNLDLDPSHGKSNWCGLCEREGHSSIVCPFENDNDDIF